ncbi:TIGR02147 family protein [Bdellovibrio svalbardensis]|uniref:TIGR02147 family protein n=1 Tax=Bdellovibrio svalbardensis TaxID=2972972 RepID=A0ABT6DJZ8_9BACT|nr:TIGR02147 family protein [Bdellovibrio svalbardensis]MDG0817192.1 TIGR02147 family protein [Bdellovibrio svalbardensis]
MSIFEFNDYKAFLRSEIKKRPGAGRGELSRLSEFLGINATMVSQVMSGPKDFTLEQAKKIAEYFVLPKVETDFFITLIQIERAGTQDLKNYFREKRDEIKKESLKISNRIVSEKRLTDLERSIFYSSHLYSAIHLFCSVGNGQSLESILKKFEISRQRAQEILQFLLSNGLCIQKNGLYMMGTQSTHVEKGSPFLIKHHSNWRIAAIQKSENIADNEMMFTANISLSQKDFAKIRETLMQTIQEISETVKASPAEEIANLNIDLFWIDS